MNNPTVYIILVNYGTPDDTVECMESILQNSYHKFKVIIVDVENLNKSVEKISLWIDAHKDNRFKLIKEHENKGFAHANNTGIKFSLSQKDCSFLWILNNDTVIDKESLARQVNFYNRVSQKEKPGFIGTKTMDYSKTDIIQNVGGVFNKWTKFPQWIGSGEKDTGQYDNAELPVDHIQGSSMFLHHTLIEAIGFMPEDYFLYFEDTDWCIKAQRAGYINKVCATGIIYHKQGASTGVKYMDDEKVLQNKYYFYKNLLKFYRLYFKRWLPAAYFFLFKKWTGRIIKGEWQEAKIIWKVIWRRQSSLGY